MGVSGFDAGPQHQEHCVACHARVTGGEGEVLYRKDRGLIPDRTALSVRVKHCQRGAGLQWSGDQINAMQAYLNARFYQFPSDE